MENQEAFDTNVEDCGHFSLDSAALDSPYSRARSAQPCSRLFKVVLLDMKVPVALHELDESVPISAVVSVAVAAAGGGNSNWEARLHRQQVRRLQDRLPRGSSSLCRHRAVYPPPHPLQGARRTPSPPTSHLARHGGRAMMLRGGRDGTVPPRPLRYVYQFLWVLLWMVVCHRCGCSVIVFPARSCLGLCQEYPSDRYWFRH